MDSENLGENSAELVAGITLPSLRASLTKETNEYWRSRGRSTFFIPNPETDNAVSEPKYSVEKSSEIVRYRDAVKVTSKRSSASVDDVLDSHQSAAAHGTRPVSYTSVTSQDVNSLLRRMVSLEMGIYGLDIT